MAMAMEQRDGWLHRRPKQGSCPSVRPRKPMNEKEHCNGQWTKARFRSFITSALRRASSRWAPKYTTKKNARTARNTYTCSLCSKSVGNKDIKIDHIHPVVDPTKGFVSWDSFIERLFVEMDGYQAICVTCHDKKTSEERLVRKAAKLR